MATAGELLAHLMGGLLGNKVGHAVVISVALLVNAGRMVLYVFIENPWLGVVGEGLNTVGGSLVFVVMTTHPVFQLIFASAHGKKKKKKKKRKKSEVSRPKQSYASEVSSVKLTLRLLWGGLGASLGCMVAGVVLQEYGEKMMFWAGGGLMVAWTLIFVLLYPCCKQRCGVRKSREASGEKGEMTRWMLQDEHERCEDEEEEEDEDICGHDDDDESEEDWLSAMQKI